MLSGSRYFSFKLERKISAAAQQRIGPEYAGALGVLQPIADGLKLLVKEDIIPAKADGILFTAGPILVLVPVILSWPRQNHWNKN